jgi:3-deoxy-7-phosphoheptulonate synthase
MNATQRSDTFARESFAGLEVLDVLCTADKLSADIPLSPAIANQVSSARSTVRDVLDGRNDRILAVVGPCSIHDPIAGIDYAQRLATAARAYADDLVVVMRTFLEKPRSIAGWKGIVHDPAMDRTGDIAAGLRIGRQFLADAAETRLPLAMEFVDPFVTPYLTDFISYATIGARTVASQPHRQLASSLPMAVGCKNTVDGGVEAAINAVRAAAERHVFPGVNSEGVPVVHRSQGNPYAHLVLRGGTSGPNYDVRSVGAALNGLSEAGLPARAVVDVSHGNSGKDYRRQPGVVADVSAQIGNGQKGLVGVMVESFLSEGAQATPLTYGVSITDACLGFEDTLAVLDTLAVAVRRRRQT